MKRIPDNYSNNLGIAQYGIEVVEICATRGQWADAAAYTRQVRYFLDRAERCARQDAKREAKFNTWAERRDAKLDAWFARRKDGLPAVGSAKAGGAA